MKFDVTWIAAYAAFFNFVQMLDSFSFGYGFATTSMMSKYLVNGQIRRSKIAAIWSMIVTCILATIFSLCIYFNPENLAKLFLAVENNKPVGKLIN